MRCGVLLLLAAAAACHADSPAGAPPGAGTAAAPAALSATACAAEATAALAARDMRRLAAVVGGGQRLAFTPFGHARREDATLRAEELDDALRAGHVRDWGTLGESDDPLRLSLSDYLARYAWSDAYAGLGPRPPGSAAFDAASNDIAALLGAIGALHPGAAITEYHQPPSAPGAMDWRVLRVVCVPAPAGGFRLARLVHSEWTP